MKKYQLKWLRDTLCFEYEPIVLTLSGFVVAYEQLARLKNGEPNADFIESLGVEGRRFLDQSSLSAAAKRIGEFGLPITINVFPENINEISEVAAGLSLGQRIGIEIHEATSGVEAAKLISKYNDLWWLLDDFTEREAFALTIMSTQFRNVPITAKLPWKHTRKLLEGSITLDTSMPASWILIAEGAAPGELSELFKKGVLLAQGRDLKGMKPCGAVADVSYR